MPFGLQSEIKAAKQLFQQVVEQEPESAAALFGLGRVAAAEGDHQSAVSHFERALELQPYADRIHYPLALSLFIMARILSHR